MSTALTIEGSVVQEGNPSFVENLFEEKRVAQAALFLQELCAQETHDAPSSSEEIGEELEGDIEDLEADIDAITGQIGKTWTDDSLTDQQKVNKVQELDRERSQKRAEIDKLRKR